MRIMQPLCRLANIKINKFSKDEIFILELFLTYHTYNAIKEFFKEQYKFYFHLIKVNKNMGDIMLESNLVRLIINDILSTGEYTLSGIAYDTHIPSEIIYDISAGINTDPSLSVSRKIMQTHQYVRSDFYRKILNRIIEEDIRFCPS
ncbi:MAG: hypothetical protein A3F11_02150 [Gammaproteobacteria bacterium RIFCSPHIGHO2_12_FULL_37_14]|nr:MAG: hypothetical protein A3F11_02150 [Gammaproteobacteria bacterium RIFCSPHIGHO2_12_FULL_37_14]